ncbi:MAG: GNAT family N-acetyltransferase [Desulfovermiculus sp.]|nr:GNAT family N-acetyltransferase [Desulfovermiculus sp.]
MPDLQVHQIDTYQDWHALTHKWDSLLQACPTATFFQTWQWLLSWVECSLNDKRSLFILACYDQGQLVGVAPWYIQNKKTGPFRLREIRFIGFPDPGSDYLAVLAAKRKERQVAEAVYAYIFHGPGQKAWDQLHLTDIRADDLFLLHFLAKVDKEGKYAELSFSGYCPYLVLPQSPEDLYAQLSPGWRKKVKQDTRVLAREQDLRLTSSSGREADRQLGTFFELFQNKSPWPNARLQAIWEKVMARYDDENPVQIDMLSVQGLTVAGLLHIKYGTTLAMYTMAVDKKYNPKISLGNYLVGQSIQNAIDQGYAIYDLLKGAEDYKFHWANQGNRTVQLRMWRKTPAGLCSALSMFSRQAGKLVLR